MAAILKISEDFYDDSFALIALHCTLEDYAIVYALNRDLKAGFKRASKDLVLTEPICFPFFEWKDDVNDRYWALIANYSVKEVYSAGEDLFVNEPSYTKHYLLSEYKEVDYFLKIEQDDLDHLDEVLKVLLKMPKIVTAYKLDPQKLKSKNHLIF
ncbi:MAG: IPExxxVDY family protein [Flavobacteriaceae bacterium]